MTVSKLTSGNWKNDEHRHMWTENDRPEACLLGVTWIFDVKPGHHQTSVSVLSSWSSIPHWTMLKGSKWSWIVTLYLQYVGRVVSMNVVRCLKRLHWKPAVQDCSGGLLNNPWSAGVRRHIQCESSRIREAPFFQFLPSCRCLFWVVELWPPFPVTESRTLGLCVWEGRVQDSRRCCFLKPRRHSSQLGVLCNECSG